MKTNEYDKQGVLLNVEPNDIIVTPHGAIRKVCPEDMPIISTAEIKRFATAQEQKNYEEFQNDKARYLTKM